MGRYDDDNDDISTPAAPSEAAPARRIVRRGWGAAEKLKDADANYAVRLKVSQTPILLKFLEDDPFAAFRQHWLERQGQRSFVCIGDDCPLCDAGSITSAQFCFNVVELSPNEDPEIRSWQVGVRVLDQLRNFHTDPRQGPLSKHYWAVSRTGDKSTSTTNLQMVRERDMLEEWSIDPLDDDTLAVLRKKAYTEDIIKIPTRKELLEIAAESL